MFIFVVIFSFNNIINNKKQIPNWYLNFFARLIHYTIFWAISQTMRNFKKVRKTGEKKR